jgi:hypothetical protein
MSLLTALQLHRVLVARALAVTVDVVQVVLVPLLGEGVLSPLNDALDLVTAAALMSLLGWRWSVLPVLGLEAIPLVDEFPTWSAFAFFATRKSGRPTVAERELPTSGEQ